MAKIYAAKNQEMSKREKNNMMRARKIASQGMVLLENDGTLPLNAKGQKIALFGSGVRHTVKGGTGSGDVNSRIVINAEQGLKEEGFIITSDNWLGRYDSICKDAFAAHMEKVSVLLREKGAAGITDILSDPYADPDVPEIDSEDISASKADLAIYIIARTSGEGKDRKPIPGDYELSEGELQNLKAVTASFAQTIVVLNVGGVIDLKPLRNNKGINAILLMGQAGNVSGYALADVLTGKVTPSGHLAMTWAENYSDYPGAANFSHMNGNLDDEFYEEGIYVGYRYFDTFGIRPAYPFGYGKSYTSFKIKTDGIDISKGHVKIRITVTNRGAEYSGREVVQVYYSAPSGKLEKPYQELAGYAKTSELKPDESETVTISFSLTDMASYDEETASYILESGKYYIRVGDHSRNTHIIAALEIDEKIVIKNLANKLTADHLQVLSANGVKAYSYPKEQEEKENAVIINVIASEIPCEAITYSQAPAEYISEKSETDGKCTLEQVISEEIILEELVSHLTVGELAELCVGTARGGFGSASVIGAASTACPGAAGDTTSLLSEDRKIPNIVLADGPAGLRLSKSFVADRDDNVIHGLGESALGGVEQLFGIVPPKRPADAIDYYQYCTAIPTATLLAQTWDLQVIEDAGDIVGEEMEEFGVTLWLAPGMNIQRNPLCGRNFEYYTEDPFVSGMCAAASTKGVQKHGGCGTCIKHFALNNQEDNRAHCNSHCTERAIREIYLRGFEIAVRLANPYSVMTSYNLINGTHAANSYELLTSILRDEWKFEGLVMSDWGTTGGGDMTPVTGTKYGYSDAAGCIKAGNDLIMPGSQKDVDEIIKAVTEKLPEEQYSLTMAELQLCAKRVLQTIIKSVNKEVL